MTAAPSHRESDHRKEWPGRGCHLSEPRFNKIPPKEKLMNVHAHTTAPAEPQALRRLRNAIEELIALVDLLDGDETLEDDDSSEHSLGWTDRGPNASRQNPLDDMEDDDPAEDGGDTEPNGDELDHNGDETDHDGGEMDFPMFIHGGQGL